MAPISHQTGILISTQNTCTVNCSQTASVSGMPYIQLHHHWPPMDTCSLKMGVQIYMAELCQTASAKWLLSTCYRHLPKPYLILIMPHKLPVSMFNHPSNSWVSCTYNVLFHLAINKSVRWDGDKVSLSASSEWDEPDTVECNSAVALQ